MSQNFFLYGPLGDADLLSIVLGREIGPSELVAARAMRRVIRASDAGSFPSLIRADGEAAPGMLLQGASAEEAARLAFFLADDGEAEELNVSASGLGDVEATAFHGADSAAAGAEPWSQESWRKARRAYDIQFARDWMSQFGRRPLAEMERLRTGIAMRVHSRLRAGVPASATTGHRLPMDRSMVELDRVETPYMDAFAIEEHWLRHRKFDGTMTDRIKRAVFASGDAVTIMPYDPALDRILMIEQFRAGPWARGDARPWCLEVVAGRIDPGETLEETVRREAREEAGVEVTALERIVGYYPTPGATAEHLTSFIGRADLSNAGGVHGLESEDEDIRVLTPSFEDAMAMLAAGEVDNAPAVISLLWLSAQRDRLRAQWNA